MRIAARSALLLLLSTAAVIQTAAQEQQQPALTCGCPTGLQRGDLSLTTAFQHTKVTRHFFSNGEQADKGHIRTNALVLSLDYALTDNFVANIAVPYVSSAYHGTSPHRLPIDDGLARGTIQDYRIDLRYHLQAGQTHVTPVIGFVAPTHNYHYLGHSAVGHDLHEQSIGINVERNLDRLLAGSYFQARYAFSFAEKVLGVSHNRSNVDVDLGYFVLPSLALRGLWSLQKTYGGIPIVLGAPRKGDLFEHHDQIARADFVGVGVGASYALNDSVDLFMTGQRMLHGRNGHKLDFSPTVGITWTFAAARRHDASGQSCSVPSKD